MLMAAGLGTRLRPFTDLEPKALIPLMGVPIAQFAVDSLARAGVERIVANIHHQAERARAGFERMDRGAAELILSDESALLLGSSGGIRKALPHFRNEPFFLVNADVLSETDLTALARTHERMRDRWGATLTLAVHPAGPPPGKYREILLDARTGLIRGLGELESARPFFIGSAVIEPQAVKDLPEDKSSEFVPNVLLPAIKEGKAAFHLTSGVWKDIGAPELWLDAHLYLLRALETGRLPQSWRRRIEKRSRRIAQETWVSNRSPLWINTTRWNGPCYWSIGLPGSDCDVPPRELGPEAVLYGSAHRDDKLVRGIGFGGTWVKIPKSG